MGTPPTYISGTQVSGGFTYTSGQSVDIFSGGQAYNMTIDKNAFEYVDVGGTARTTIVNLGGEVDVTGGTASGSKLSGGVQSVTSDSFAHTIGTASNTTVYKGGVEDLSSGGTDYSTIISSSGGEHVYSGGISYNATVAKGGTDFVTEGGIASNTTVEAGGRIILAGQVLDSANFTATSGSEKAVGVYAGGVETVTITGVKSSPYDKIVISGDDKKYYQGAKLKLDINRVGNELYDTIYTSSGAVTTSRFSQAYPDAGSAATVTVQKGGSAVLAGGSAAGLTVASGGTEIIGGPTTVHSGGATYKFNFTGDTVSDSHLTKGAKQVINAGNTALSATISAGGVQVVKKGATARDSVIDGGTLQLASGGTLGTEVTFSGTGGELVISGAVMPTATISGFAAGDKIKLAGVKYAAGDKATVKTAGIVTVSAGGHTYALHIAGATVGEGFKFGSGSLLTETAPAQMSFLAPSAAAETAGDLPAITHAPARIEAPLRMASASIAAGLYEHLTSAAPSTAIAGLNISGGF
jgi:autotransporter passenger strand-loop-strand repeat protein